MTESSTELKLVKLLIVMQVHLELLDELQTTPLYRHNIIAKTSSDQSTTYQRISSYSLICCTRI
jgi:hypothetical protein